MPEVFTALFQPELPAMTLAIGLLVGTFVSEDAACILAAGSVASGRLSFGIASAACFVGIFVGDLLLYGTGRLLGEATLETRFVKRLAPADRILKARSWYERNASSAILTSRFISGLRLPTYLLAGVIKGSFGKFAFFTALAAAIWTPLLIVSVVWAQSSLFARNSLIGLIAAFATLQVAVPYLRYENRRLLLGRLKRIKRWEFWPVQVFYLPVIAYLIILAVRHRSLTMFTAANPCLPAGGFKGESKHEIYRMLSASNVTGSAMLLHILLPETLDHEEKLRRTCDFMTDRGLDFPVVIKPDAGERGRSVFIVYNWQQLKKAIDSSYDRLIVQEFCDGVEASVFYVHEPGQPHGRIFSITEKSFPFLVGDGTSTFKELVLADSRAVCLAKNYFRRHADKLATIPGKGDRVHLIDIGTHSQGAAFLSGDWLRSDKLEERIDQICRSLPGFYFGRFDLRAATFDELQNGNFKIIELNGVTSESTNIYDPRFSLIDAYRTLFRQWKLAFSIGSANHALGAPLTRLADLIGLALGATARSVRPIEQNAVAAEI